MLLGSVETVRIMRIFEMKSVNQYWAMSQVWWARLSISADSDFLLALWSLCGCLIGGRL